MTDTTTTPAPARAAPPMAPARADLADFLDDATLPECAREPVEQTLTTKDAARHAHLAAFERTQEAADLRASRLRELARHREAAASTGYRLDPERLAELEIPVQEATRRLERERAAQQAAGAEYQVHAGLAAALTEFLRQHSPGTLRPAPVTKLPKGATVETLRDRLAAIDDEGKAAEQAPLTRAEIIEDLKREVGEIAARGAPRISQRALDGRPARLAQALMVASGPNSMLLGDAGARLWTWLFHDEIIAALAELVPEDQPGALNRKARAQKIAALQAERLQVERAEEQMIRAARREGRIIARRPEASPEAVLQVTVRRG